MAGTKIWATLLRMSNSLPRIYPRWPPQTDICSKTSAGGYFQSISDLSTLGRSILSSSLLSAPTTRRWLKPISHTASPIFSVGQPWEILRLKVPISIPSNKTRTVDLYAKTGGIGQYIGALGLSPDHDLGVSILVAGGNPTPAATFGVLQGLALGIWLPATEQAAREQAGSDFAGRYVFGGDNSSATFSLAPDEPGLFLESLVSNGSDILTTLGGVLGGGAGGPAVRWGAWLYPTIDSKAVGGRRRKAFRAVLGQVGVPVGGTDACASWSPVDAVRYGGNPVDLFVFEHGADGRATAVEVPFLKKTLVRMDS